MSIPVVEVENLSFRYDKRLDTETLSNISFTIQKGDWIAIVGHNGSGKSTLAQLLVGLLEPQNGRIFIVGKELNNESKWEIRRHIGIVFQNPDNQFVGTTVQDDVAFGLENINMPYDEMKWRIDKALSMVEISSLRFQDPSRLSGGQKQRVAIAGVLALNPAILVLDEAFVMLDPKSRRALLDTLQYLRKTENLTIISITHDMNEAAAADLMLVMKNGQIVNYGPPPHIFNQELDLEPPFPEHLRRILRQRNGEVPDIYMSEKEMVEWLCKLRLSR